MYILSWRQHLVSWLRYCLKNNASLEAVCHYWLVFNTMKVLLPSLELQSFQSKMCISLYEVCSIVWSFFKPNASNLAIF